MTHIALLHRARTALMFPNDLIDKRALLADLDKAIEGAYPKRVKAYCWCGDNAVDGHHCNDHSEFQTGDG